MKRVLIICYYWPPAGGPGVQRWLKFVKYFREFEIEPVLYIPKNPHYPIIDSSFESEIPMGLEIIQYPIMEPYRYAKLLSKKKTKKISSGIINEKKPSFLENLMLAIRGNLFIPDARVGWVKPSVKFLANYLSENKDIETIITTGPPHSLHLIGMALKNKFQLNWVADFRDPWTTIHYHNSLRLSANSKKRHKKLEAQVLNTADTIVVTSPTTKRDFQKITSNPIELITNGFDTNPLEESALDSKFSLVHIGSVLSNRNPTLLWEILAALISEVPNFKNDLEIKLIGLVASEIKETINYYGLSENLLLTGYVSHNEALRFQQNAQVLLLIEMNKQETRAIIPGKLFEYLRSQRPIIALGPEKSDIEGILKETQAGDFFNYTEEQRLKDKLLALYHLFLDGKLQSKKTNIEMYSRKSLTSRMASLIKEV